MPGWIGSGVRRTALGLVLSVPLLGSAGAYPPWGCGPACGPPAAMPQVLVVVIGGHGFRHGHHGFRHRGFSWHRRHSYYGYASYPWRRGYQSSPAYPWFYR